MIRVALTAALCLTGTAAIWGQAAAGAPAGTGKIAILNVRQAIVATAEGKQASAELQSQFTPRQNELEALNKQINDLRQQLTANNTTWSDEQKARAQAQGQRLAQQMDRKQQEMQTDVNDAQSEVVDRIGRKMMDVLDRYARESGFVAVFDSSSQNSPIIYAANSIDVTQEIIKLYDQAYPVKSSAAPAAKPAAPKSTPPPAAKP
jgi:outer membrane protein